MCLYSAHQQHRCSASNAQGVQHGTQCPQPFSVQGQLGDTLTHETCCRSLLTQSYTLDLPG